MTRSHRSWSTAATPPPPRSDRCARFESCSGLSRPFTFLLERLPAQEQHRCGGRNRSRTCDLFLVMEALVPTELCARVRQDYIVANRSDRRFALGRELRWYQRAAAAG